MPETANAESQPLMPEPTDQQFEVESGRDAHDAVRGFVYQVHVTLLDWLELSDEHVLELECAEDIDEIADGLRTAKQIKAERANVTLRAESVVGLLARHVHHTKLNPETILRTQLVTTASAGREKPSPFDHPKKALEEWSVAGASDARPAEADLLNLFDLLKGHVDDSAKTLEDNTIVYEPPKGVSAAAWEDYRKFLTAFDADLMWSLTKMVAFHLDQPDDATRQDTVVARFAERHPLAERLYECAFVQVFRIMARNDERKLLTADGLRHLAAAAGPSHPASQEFAELQAKMKVLAEEYRTLERRLDQVADQVLLSPNQLQALTDRFLRRLERAASLPAEDGTPFLLERSATEVITAAATRGHLAIVGKPGVGKSVALYSAAAALAEDGHQVRAISASEMTRYQWLNLAAVLLGTGGVGGFLVVDGLDQVREEALSNLMNDALESVAADTSWTIVASVRSWDLERRVQLRRVFKGTPDEQFRAHGPDLARVHHVAIPEFNDAEMAWLAARNPTLHAAATADSGHLRELFRNGFNLRIAAELLLDGLPADRLAVATSASELLDWWWAERVEQPSSMDGEDLAFRIIDEMIAERSSLALRPLLPEGSASRALVRLFSASVIVEPRRRFVAFGHRILLDYAVERYIFSDPVSVVIGRLASDPELAVFAQASLRMALGRRWFEDRSEFWALSSALYNADGVPEVARIAAAVIMAENLTEVADAEPLSEALEGGGAGNLRMARHLSTLLDVSQGDRPLLGPTSRDWAGVAELLGSRPSWASQEASVVLLWVLLRNTDQVPDAPQAERLARASAQLLANSLANGKPTSRECGIGLEGAVRFFGSAPDECAKAISALLHHAAYQHLAPTVFRGVGEHLTVLIAEGPAMLEAIYMSAIGWDGSADSVQMGDQILTLSMDARQLWDRNVATPLVEQFPLLIEACPQAAIRVLVAALESDFEAHQADIEALAMSLRETLSEPEESPAQEERVGVMVTDDLRIREGNLPEPHSDSLELQLLVAWKRGIELRLEAGANVLSDLREALAHSGHVGLWRAVLELAAAHPESVGVPMVWLAQSDVLLAYSDTGDATANLIEAVHPRVAPAEQESIERAVLKLLDRWPDYPEACREVLSRISAPRLPEAVMIAGTPADTARELVASEIDALTQQALEEVRREALGGTLPGELEVTLDVVRHSGASPTDALNALEALNDRLPALSGPRVDGAWAEISRVASSMLGDGGNHLGEADRERLMRLLLGAVGLLGGPIRPERARELAVDALVVASLRGWLESPTLEELATHLLVDPSEHVRSEYAVRLREVHVHRDRVFWSSVDAIAEHDPSPRVAQWTLRALSQAAARHTQEAARAFAAVQSIAFRRDQNEVQEQGIQAMALIHVWTGLEDARSAVQSRFAPPESLALLSGALLTNAVESKHRDAEAIRQRSWSLLLEFSEALVVAWETVKRGDASDDAERTFRLLDRLSIGLYFTSGSSGRKATSDRSDLPPDDHKGRLRFLVEVEPVIRVLARVGHPKIAHNLIKAIEGLREYDPRLVLILAAAVVEDAAEWGFGRQQLALNEVTDLVEHYLANHREALQSDEVYRRALLTCMDSFVAAGWPKAISLAMKIDRMYQ